jgi:hypothetical protein
VHGVSPFLCEHHYSLTADLTSLPTNTLRGGLMPGVKPGSWGLPFFFFFFEHRVMFWTRFLNMFCGQTKLFPLWGGLMPGANLVHGVSPFFYLYTVSCFEQVFGLVVYHSFIEMRNNHCYYQFYVSYPGGLSPVWVKSVSLLLFFAAPLTPSSQIRS